MLFEMNKTEEGLELKIIGRKIKFSAAICDLALSGGKDFSNKKGIIGINRDGCLVVALSDEPCVESLPKKITVTAEGLTEE